jgi:uncharacterized protein YbjT (DUF2867 family)
MRLLVLGASGGVGRWVTRLAAKGRHEVTALVRPGTPFQPPPGVDVKRGSVLDLNDLFRAAEDKDAVISCVGPQRIDPRNPFSPLRHPLHIAERSARAIVEVVSGSSVKRVAAISAAGVGDSLDRTSRIMRWLLERSTIGAMYADLASMEHVLRGSDLDWIAVRPVTLIDWSPSTRTRTVPRFRAHSIISRVDVAAWLLQAVERRTAIADRTPMIAWW